MNARRVGLACLAIGVLIAATVQIVGPLADPPLYDGVVPAEPYRWLDPPPGSPGGATGASGIVAIADGQNALVAVATPELSPQAQVFAAPGVLSLPTGTTSIEVTIEPVESAVAPLDGYVDGNVYRFKVTSQDGSPITAPASARVTVVLRAANPGLSEATIDRFNGFAWEPLETSPAGIGSFIAVVTQFGEFAVVANGVSPYPSAPGAGEASSGLSSGATITPAGSAGAPPSGAGSPATPSGPAESPIPPAVLVVGALLFVIAGLLAILGTRRRARRARARKPYRGATRRR